MSMVRVSFSVEKDHAEQVEEVTGKPIAEVAKELVDGYFDDKRRNDVPTAKTSIAWSVPVYSEMVRRAGSGGISAYIRETMSKEFGKRSKVFLNLPDWKESRKRNAKAPKVVILTPGAERQSVNIPLIIPKEWKREMERLEIHSGEIKAAVQLRLERETGKRLPVQRQMAKYLGRDF